MPRLKSSSAKAKSKFGRKAAAIREVLIENPRAKMKEILAKLGEKGIKVSSAFVYVIRSKMRRKAKRVARATVDGKPAALSPVDLVVRVKALAGDTGGMKTLKQLVDALAE